jgi:hypothetical protein
MLPKCFDSESCQLPFGIRKLFQEPQVVSWRSFLICAKRRLPARETRRTPGFGGFVLRQSDVFESQHGKILADGGAKGESGLEELPGQLFGPFCDGVGWV